MVDLQEKILINDAYYQALLADILEAKQSIDLEVYIFAEDALGLKIANALAAAAKRGVKVRVLVDGVGTSWGGEISILMEKAGVVTRVFHPLPWVLRHFLKTHMKTSLFSKMIYLIHKINKRNHRKTSLIDHEIAYVGSANMSRSHLSREANGEGFRDTTVRISGVNFQPLEVAFERAWHRYPLYERATFIFQKVKYNSYFRLNDSWRRRRALYKEMLKRLSHSQKRIWITNAYFIPDSVLLKKLIQAARRGVEVKILLPYRSDVFIYPLISAFFYTQLLKSGIEIFEYKPSVLHAKILMLDDWYCVGSSNLNYRSLRHDLEVDVNLQTQAAKIILEKQFMLDLDQAQKVDLEQIKQQPRYKKIFAWILLYLQYWF